MAVIKCRRSEGYKQEQNKWSPGRRTAWQVVRRISGGDMFGYFFMDETKEYFGLAAACLADVFLSVSFCICCFTLAFKLFLCQIQMRFFTLCLTWFSERHKCFKCHFINFANQLDYSEVALQAHNDRSQNVGLREKTKLNLVRAPFVLLSHRAVSPSTPANILHILIGHCRCVSPASSIPSSGLSPGRGASRRSLGPPPNLQIETVICRLSSKEGGG